MRTTVMASSSAQGNIATHLKAMVVRCGYTSPQTDLTPTRTPDGHPWRLRDL